MSFKEPRTWLSMTLVTIFPFVPLVQKPRIFHQGCLVRASTDAAVITNHELSWKSYRRSILSGTIFSSVRISTWLSVTNLSFDSFFFLGTSYIPPILRFSIDTDAIINRELSREFYLNEHSEPNKIPQAYALDIAIFQIVTYWSCTWLLDNPVIWFLLLLRNFVYSIKGAL